jgi:hypothetical protein
VSRLLGVRVHRRREHRQGVDVRNVLRNTAEVCHYWANAVQDYGRNGNDTVYFRGELIYSYGSHFCMARRLPGGVVVETNRTYSPTTNRHQREVWNAVRHMTLVYCERPEQDAAYNMKVAREEVERLLESAKRPRIHGKTRVNLRAAALAHAQQANAYLDALPLAERGVQTPIDTSNLEGVAAELAAMREAEERLKAEERNKRLLKACEDMHLWRAGELNGTYGLHELAVALRLHGEVIQTSYGAEIPVADALMLWPVIQRVMRGDKAYTPGMPIGHYRLTQIRTDGSIKVGCHDIAYGEIERMAVALGLIEQETAA